jgi:hypothetical protein
VGAGGGFARCLDFGDCFCVARRIVLFILFGKVARIFAGISKTPPVWRCVRGRVIWLFATHIKIRTTIYDKSLGPRKFLPSFLHFFHFHYFEFVSDFGFRMSDFRLGRAVLICGFQLHNLSQWKRNE